MAAARIKGCFLVKSLMGVFCCRGETGFKSELPGSREDARETPSSCGLASLDLSFYNSFTQLCLKITAVDHSTGMLGQKPSLTLPWVPVMIGNIETTVVCCLLETGVCRTSLCIVGLAFFLNVQEHPSITRR